jgi:hypothetical protein
MGYQNMDHASWVESNIAASKRVATNLKRRTKRSDNTKGFSAAPDTLSEFQAKVFDILGMVGGGIYNAPIAWESIQWGSIGISIPWDQPLATWDFQQLTMLVFLCHEARIRCSIKPHGPRCLLLAFHQREAGDEFSRRHPNLDEAVAAFREYLPEQHRIIHTQRELAA